MLRRPCRVAAIAWLWLAGVQAGWASEPAAPCPTPCLRVPHDKPAPEASTAAQKPQRPPAARTRPVATREAAPARSPRCARINLRAAVGEPLSDEDMQFLRSHCG